jgi:electron transport complex protein RnfA
MSSLLIILLGSVLVSYFAITTSGVLQPIASDDAFDSAVAIAAATAIGLALLSPVSWLVDRFALRPLHIEFLAPVIFAMLIVLLALGIEVVFRSRTRWLPHRMGFVLLMTTQGALLGVMLQGRFRSETFLQALLSGVGAGVSFAALLLAFASMQQRLRAADVPVAFKLAPTALITVGIMALALMGLTGLVRE